MRCLICGIGSIGQRHYKNLQLLGQELALFRSRETMTPFISAFFGDQKSRGCEPKVFYDLEEALAEFRPEAVFVANPNHCHMEVAIPAAKFGCHVFLEKPASHNLEGLDVLTRLVREKNIKVMVGYNLRFHPLLLKMKSLVEEGQIGVPLSAHVDSAENVEDWHPWENYRETYSVWRRSGGGIVLCFSHDVDYLYWFFGRPSLVVAVGGKVTPLDGDAEDMVKALWQFKSGFTVSIHLDYWQNPKRRIFEIVGTKGNISWSQHEGNLVLTKRGGAGAACFHDPAGFERNSMFIEEARHFIGCVEADRELLIPLSQGVDVLKISLAIKNEIGF